MFSFNHISSEQKKLRRFVMIQSSVEVLQQLTSCVTIYLLVLSRQWATIVYFHGEKKLQIIMI